MIDNRGLTYPDHGTFILLQSNKIIRVKKKGKNEKKNREQTEGGGGGIDREEDKEVE